MCKCFATRPFYKCKVLKCKLLSKHIQPLFDWNGWKLANMSFKSATIPQNVTTHLCHLYKSIPTFSANIFGIDKGWYRQVSWYIKRRRSRYLGRCSMTSCLENSCYSDVEEKQYPWIDINWPIMIGIKVEFIRRGAVSWYDDVLQTKESRHQQREKRERERKRRWG